MSTGNDQGVMEFDLVVIGGGSGGLAAAFRAAGHGARVAMLEPNALGGTCVNVGCVPKKAMWLAAYVAENIALASRLGFDVGAPRLDWCEFITHRQRYIHNIHESYRKRLDAAGIVAMPTRGRLLDANTVETSDGVRLQAPHIVIATGGHPWRPDVPGAGLGLVSDDFFHFDAAPGRVGIVGGGYIAVELAGVLQSLGCCVELFVRGPRLLGGFDRELAERLQHNYHQAGVALHFDHALQSLHDAGAGKRQIVDGVGERSQPLDAVIFATGRRPNTVELGLASAGVDTDRQGHVLVDAFQNTSTGGIYAIGDVTDRIALTPVAIAAARRLMDRLFAGKADAKLDYDNIPTVVFSHPPMATVGLSEEDARERHGDEVHVYRADFRAMVHALADVPQRSLFKLVCVGSERRVIGIHLLGEAADEIMQGFAVALKKGIVLDDLADTVAIHPTSAEEVVLMR